MQSSLPRALQAIEPRFHAVRLTRNVSEGDASRRLLPRTRYRTSARRLLSPCIRTSLTRDELLCSSSADWAQIHLLPISSRAMRRHLLPPARTHQACPPPSRQLLPLRLLFDALPLRPWRRVSHDVSCSDSFLSVSQVSGTGAPRSKFSSTARRT